MARALSLAFLAVAVTAAPGIGQQPDPARVAQLRTIRAELLGRAYLVNENTLRLIAVARQGVNVMLSDGDATARSSP